jgi:DNA-binding IclR family transcriptional regulator
MASFPPVQSVVRALDVLDALNRRPISTIDDLHGQTGIPKPSIVRLLQTLRAARAGRYFHLDRPHAERLGMVREA